MASQQGRENYDKASVPRSMKLRGYQERIVNEIGKQNGIVLLPTGSGKTLIASELLSRFHKQQKSSSVFLVPARVLVPQQAIAIKQWTNLRVGQFMGGLKLPKQFDILVSTPLSFLSAQRRSETIQWSHIGMVIFDEVHHVLKDHPYRNIARRIPEQVQIVGMTASLTYGVTEKQVKKTVQRMTIELRLKVLATATDDELKRDGYHGKVARTERQTADYHIKGTVPLKDRKPHLMYDIFWNRWKNNKLTTHARIVMDIIRSLEKETTIIMVKSKKLFQSPLKNKKLASWGIYAHDKGLLVLEHWYEALRIIVMNWEEADGLELAVAYLKMMNAQTLRFYQKYSDDIRTKIEMFFAEYGQFTPKLDRLKNILLQKRAESISGLRAIVFVQQKVSVHLVTHFISTNIEFKSKGLKAVCLYSTNGKTPTPSLCLSKKQANDALKQFEKGTANILVCTTVAEEGIDVAAANCVVRFNSVLNSVSFVQGRGRARHENSSFVVMSEEKERTVDKLESIENLQGNIADTFDRLDLNSEEYLKKEHIAQQSRERNAKMKILSRWKGGERSMSLSLLNGFCRTTKVPLLETYCKQNGSYSCNLEYKSCLRTLTASGKATTKKQAKKSAAVGLLDKLSRTV